LLLLLLLNKRKGNKKHAILGMAAAVHFLGRRCTRARAFYFEISPQQ